MPAPAGQQQETWLPEAARCPGAVQAIACIGSLRRLQGVCLVSATRCEVHAWPGARSLRAHARLTGDPPLTKMRCMKRIMPAGTTSSAAQKGRTPDHTAKVTAEMYTAGRGGGKSKADGLRDVP